MTKELRSAAFWRNFRSIQFVRSTIEVKSQVLGIKMTRGARKYFSAHDANGNRVKLYIPQPEEGKAQTVGSGRFGQVYRVSNLKVIKSKRDKSKAPQR